MSVSPEVRHHKHTSHACPKGEQENNPQELFEMLLSMNIKQGFEHLEDIQNPLYIVNSSGEKVPLAPEIYTPLETIVRAIKAHKTVKVIEQDRMMTTQEAADYLGMSRPSLVKLLESGEIPFEKLKKHRRIAFADIENYRIRRAEYRRETLEEMAHEEIESGLLQATSVSKPIQLRRL